MKMKASHATERTQTHLADPQTRRARKVLSVLAFILPLTACHAVIDTSLLRPAPSTDTRDQIIAALAGVWDNRAQFAAAPAAVKVPPSVAGDWLDLQHARFLRVIAPQIGTHVLYLEWRSGGADGVISRQRIWSFRVDDAGVLRMDFFAFVDGKPWAAKVSADDANMAFRTLTPAQLRGYGSACGLRYQLNLPMFEGQIGAQECQIIAASGRRMGIDARVTMLADGTLHYKESGRLDDGRYAFRVPPSQPYQFVKLPNR